MGLTEAEARAADPQCTTVRAEFAENDRAATAPPGAAASPSWCWTGAGGCWGRPSSGPHAGELIGLVALAIGQKAKLSALAAMTLPYPTLTEIVKRAAGAYYTPALFSRRTRFLVRLLSWFG